MRIWLHGRVLVAPEIRTGNDGEPVVYGGVFTYWRWQRWLNRIAPRTFPNFGVYYDLRTGQTRVCGILVDSIIRRYGRGDTP